MTPKQNIKPSTALMLFNFSIFLLLLLCAANKHTETTVDVAQWADGARVEAQVATVAPIVRTCNPTDADRSHVAQRTGIVVARAASREIERYSCFS